MRRSSRHAKQTPVNYAQMVHGKGSHCGDEDGSLESCSREEGLPSEVEEVVAGDDESSSEKTNSSDDVPKPKPKKRRRGRPRKKTVLPTKTKPNEKKRGRPRGPRDLPQDPEAAAPLVVEIRLHLSLKASNAVGSQMKFKVSSCPKVLRTERMRYPDGCSFDDVFDMVDDCVTETIEESAGDLDALWSNSIYAWKEKRAKTTKPLTGKAEAFEITGEDEFKNYMERYAYKSNSKNIVIVDIACWVQKKRKQTELMRKRSTSKMSSKRPTEKTPMRMPRTITFEILGSVETIPIKPSGTEIKVQKMAVICNVTVPQEKWMYIPGEEESDSDMDAAIENISEPKVYVNLGIFRHFIIEGIRQDSDANKYFFGDAKKIGMRSRLYVFQRHEKTPTDTIRSSADIEACLVIILAKRKNEEESVNVKIAFGKKANDISIDEFDGENPGALELASYSEDEGEDPGYTYNSQTSSHDSRKVLTGDLSTELLLKMYRDTDGPLYHGMTDKMVTQLARVIAATKSRTEIEHLTKNLPTTDAEVAFLVQKFQSAYYLKEFNRLSPENGKFKPVIPSIEMPPPHPIDGNDSTSSTGGPIDRLIAAVAGQRGGIPAASVNEILTIKVSSQHGELLIFLGLQNDPSNTVNCTVFKILREKAKQVIPRRPYGSEIIFQLTKKDKTIIVLRKDAAKMITMAECFTMACLEKGDVIEIEMAVVDIEERIDREVHELSD